MKVQKLRYGKVVGEPVRIADAILAQLSDAESRDERDGALERIVARARELEGMFGVLVDALATKTFVNRDGQREHVIGEEVIREILSWDYEVEE
jgi:hypothetical protein